MESDQKSPNSPPKHALRAGDKLRPHEFFLVRFVPHVARGEFINIGLVLREFRETGDTNPAPARVRIAPDYKRLLGLFPDANVRYLYDAQRLIEKTLSELAIDGVTDTPSFEKILDQWSLNIQLTDPQGCLADDIDSEFGLLMRMYVNPSYELKDKSERPPQEALLAGGLPEVDVSGPLGLYTEEGDPLEFDYAYSTATTTYLIHAICIGDGIEPALALAHRAPSLREGAMKVDGKHLQLTIVTEMPPDRLSEMSDDYAVYEFAVSSMRKAGITVRTVAEIPGITAEIRHNLQIL